MNIYKIGFILLLVGIPACSGAYMTARYFGSSKTSGGAYLLVFAFLAGIGLYLFPVSRWDSLDYSYAIITIFGLALVIGVILGVLFKHRNS